MTTAKEGSLEKYLTPVAFLLGAIIIAVAIAFGSGGKAPLGKGDGTPSTVDIKDVKTDNSPYIGSLTAPVTIAVWYDFQCRYCKQFEATTLSQVAKDYVESGEVRIVYKDFQFLGPASLETALYSRAVWEVAPNSWNAWFTKVMASEGETTLAKAGLDAIAGTLGIDVTRVAKLMADKKTEYTAAADADKLEGQSFGISGTPGSIIGTTLIGGAMPYLATGRPGEQPVKDLIEAQLNK